MGRPKKRLECIEPDRYFDEKEISDIPIKKVFHKKWIILRKLEKRGKCYCYFVGDKKLEAFGTLYVEIGHEGVSSIGYQIEFLVKQLSYGNEHRFTNLIDCGVLNDHLFYMVTAEKAGPTLEQLLNCEEIQKNPLLPPETTAFIAIDFFQCVEILVSTGYMLKNFNPKRWKYDPVSRKFYIADSSDIGPITDKRYAVVNERHFIDHRNNLCWNSVLKHAPINYLLQKAEHRMSEFDMIEVFVYVIYEMGIGALPWTNQKDLKKMVELKHKFLQELPDIKIDEPLRIKLHMVIQNVLERLKVARSFEERIKKNPVRDGAWCPNGSRAGALISTFDYASVFDDFQSVVLGKQPFYRTYWRNIKLAWETEVDQSQENLKICESLELHQIHQRTCEINKLLRSKYVHYEIMVKHGEMEERINRVDIAEYLVPEKIEDE